MGSIIANCYDINSDKVCRLRSSLVTMLLLSQLAIAENKAGEPQVLPSSPESTSNEVQKEADSRSKPVGVRPIRNGGSLLEIDDLNASMLTPLMKKYLEERGEGVLDIQGHRRIAGWALENGMKEQAKAHWYGVLSYDPNDQIARKKLQFERVNGEWLTKDEIVKAQSASRELLKQTKAWMPTMRKWVGLLQGTDSKEKLKTLEALKNFKEPQAVFALQATALQLPDDIAVPFVAAIHNTRSKQACEALVNIAVNAPSSKRGLSAIAGIKEYPRAFYMPELIESLSTDIVVEHRIFQRPNGEKILRIVQSKELRDVEHVAVVDKVVQVNRAIVRKSEVKGVALSFGLGMVALDTSLSGTAKEVIDRDIEREGERTRVEVDQINAKENLRQDRVKDVLRACSLENVADGSPESWWKSWDQTNETWRSSAKDYNFVYKKENRAPIQVPVIRTIYCSCLVPGTLIQTETGLRPIEKLRIGDLVLAQDVETGTLALKPVLKTTLRSPALTRRFATKSDTIQATLGHYWWVDSCGWLRTKELEIGMPLHLANGTSVIESIEEVDEEIETFNLVVDDFHTYFVGRDLILSNDATEVRPTMRATPGSPDLVKTFVSK